MRSLDGLTRTTLRNPVPWLQARIDTSEEELTKEADCVSHLTGKMGGACDLADAPDTSMPGDPVAEL